MSIRLKNKVVIVTGGGSGIGEAISVRFAKEGATVIILELNQQVALSVLEKIKQGGKGKAVFFSCDVSSQKNVKETFKKIVDKFSKIDILINNAGIAYVGNIENTNEENFDRVYQVNVKGVYLGMKEAILYMLKQKEGVILNLASIASKIGLQDRFAYSMSKGAVLTMTFSVAKDYINEGIRVNCICPARVHTPFVDGFIKKNYLGKEKEMFEKLSSYQPLGRMGQPSEIAALAFFLCSDEAAFITGSAYDIDGGVTHLR